MAQAAKQICKAGSNRPLLRATVLRRRSFAENNAGRSWWADQPRQQIWQAPLCASCVFGMHA